MESRFTRRSALKVGGSAFALALLAACGQAPAQPAAPAPTTAPAAGAATPAGAPTAPPSAGRRQSTSNKKISGWYYYGQAQSEPLEKIIDAYREKNDITIDTTYVPSTDLLKKVQAGIAGNALPDFGMLDLIWVPVIQKVGQLQPIDDYVKAANEDPKDFFESLIQYDTGPDGKLYGLPMDTNNIQLFYNKKLLLAAGFDFDKNPPKTWDELVAAAEKTTDMDKKTWGYLGGVNQVQGQQGSICIRHMTFTWQSGADYFAKDGKGNLERGMPVFNSEKGVQAWQYYVDMINKQKVCPLQPPTEGFQTGFAAMTQNGPWNIPSWLKQIGDKFDLGACPYPAPASNPAGIGHSWSGGEHFSIYKNSNNQRDEASKFIVWLAGKENVEEFAKNTGYIPTRNSVINGSSYKAWLEKNPLYKPFADGMAKTHPRVVLPYYDKLTVAVSLKLEDAIYQRKTVKEALDAAVKDVEEVFKDEGYAP